MSKMYRLVIPVVSASGQNYADIVIVAGDKLVGLAVHASNSYGNAV